LKRASSQGTITPVLPIGEIARRAGLRPSAIRYYERLGLLPRPERESGCRRYGEETLLRLRVIQFARASGFSLSEIRGLLGGRTYSPGLRQLAVRKISELEQSIERGRAVQAVLRRAMRCRCQTVEECGRRLAVDPLLIHHVMGIGRTENREMTTRGTSRTR
jgi:DNA-binding transcriptional MerR regulator